MTHPQDYRCIKCKIGGGKFQGQIIPVKWSDEYQAYFHKPHCPMLHPELWALEEVA